MKLITKELENRFQEIGDQTLSSNPIVVAKFINPRSDQLNATRATCRNR